MNIKVKSTVFHKHLFRKHPLSPHQVFLLWRKWVLNCGNQQVNQNCLSNDPATQFLCEFLCVSTRRSLGK